MMQDVYALIRQNARDYVPIDIIEDFIQRVARWEPQIKAHFHQVTQSDGETGLELGAWVERGLLDLTAASKGEVTTTLIPLESIASVRLREEAGRVTLEVSTTGQVQLAYQASGDTSRRDLKAYFTHLEEILREPARRPAAGPSPSRR